MNPNSVVLTCTAADADRVNAEFAALIGDPEDARNLSVPLSADGSTITHYSGHGWWTDDDVAKFADITGLSVSAAALDGKPMDHYLLAIDSTSMRQVRKDEADQIVVEARRMPEDAKRVTDAKLVANGRVTDAKAAAEERAEAGRGRRP